MNSFISGGDDLVANKVEVAPLIYPLFYEAEGTQIIPQLAAYKKGQLYDLIETPEFSDFQVGFEYKVKARGCDNYQCDISDGRRYYRTYKIEKVYEITQVPDGKCWTQKLPAQKVSLELAHWQKLYPKYKVSVKPAQEPMDWKTHNWVRFKTCLTQKSARILDISNIEYLNN